LEVVFILGLLLAYGLLKPRRRRRASRLVNGILRNAPTQTVRPIPAAASDIGKVQETTYRGRCWVIDGDTIDINGMRLRLAGIDAPELDHPHGQKAKRALMRLCKGQVIRAVVEGGQSYDRLVATCYLPDGTDLSAEMVKTGHAIDWPKFSGGKYSHLEPDGIRQRLWRCDARQKGRMPQSLPD
jgi:endonuclease YncB( thermonuclease family)